jgi:hypothetical protein
MLERVADRGLAAGVDKEIARRERHMWPTGKPRFAERLVDGPRYRQECRRWWLDKGPPVCCALHSVGQQFENAVADVNLLLQPLVFRKSSQNTIQDRVDMPREDLVRVDWIKWRLLDA